MVPILKYLGIGDHFNSLLRGVIDSRDLVYYLSVIVFFIYLNVASLGRRKWN
ncbi:hypothetical protein IPJ72_01795 [Candidatus Peregrinibacteria bacterium]|nr:MAG: hypothetical protein IPJ72_01795 [Candidatus Peregrinibacteria bacterium]